jgi:hypothetical protein
MIHSIGVLGLDHRQVVARAAAQQVGSDRPSVGEDDLDRAAAIGVGDHVAVGHDPAFVVDHEPRSEAGSIARVDLDRYGARQQLFGDSYGVGLALGGRHAFGPAGGFGRRRSRYGNWRGARSGRVGER